jgi:nitrogen fixation-related uncharacterized protein
MHTIAQTTPDTLQHNPIMGVVILIAIAVIVLWFTWGAKRYGSQPDPKTDFGERIVRHEHANGVILGLVAWGGGGLIAAAFANYLLNFYYHASPNIVGLGTVLPLAIGVALAIHSTAKGMFRWSNREGWTFVAFITAVGFVILAHLTGAL